MQYCAFSDGSGDGDGPIEAPVTMAGDQFNNGTGEGSLDEVSYYARSRQSTINSVRQALIESPLLVASGSVPGMVVAAAAPSAVSKWEQTILASIDSIVAIKATQTRSFDTEVTGAYHATGFLVGSYQSSGSSNRDYLVLSNRHVVSAGPVVAKAIFADYEQVNLRAVYRDPVHDFGFFTFTQSDIDHVPLRPLKSHPRGAKIGTDIRVIGNDAGEKLSILQGTLARLDRPAPHYGVGVYTDFNTFYMQAASSTSGGSSGSPVLNQDGDVVALNAGASNKSSASYFLPLDRIERAMKLLLAGQHVSRGTVQVEWTAMALDEARRMGLRLDVAGIGGRRASTSTMNVLVCKCVVPGGPADGALEEGDFLLKVEGEMINGFVELEAKLDEHVGRWLNFTVQRGEEVITVDIRVQDLHSISPDRFVEFGDGVIHNISYTIAHSYLIPAKGVYVACSGCYLSNAGISGRSLLLKLNNCELECLNDFIRALRDISDGQTFTLKHRQLDNVGNIMTATVKMNRRFFPFRLAVRNDQTGFWDYTHILPSSNGLPMRISNNVTLNDAVKEMSLTQLAASSKKSGLKMTSSLPKNAPQNIPDICINVVSIQCEMPVLIEGVSQTITRNVIGYIVDPYLGIIVTSRSAIPISTCSIEVTFANHESIEGRLIYIDPKFPIAFVAFPVAASKRDRRSEPMQTSASCFPCLQWWNGKEGMDATQNAEQLELPYSMVGMSVFTVSFPSSTLVPSIKQNSIGTLVNVNFATNTPPKFRPLNVETLALDVPLTQSGLLVTALGKLCGFNVSINAKNNETFFSIPSFPVAAILNRLRASVFANDPRYKLAGHPSAGPITGVFHLEAELGLLSLSVARNQGLSSEWVSDLSVNNFHQSVLQVNNVFVTSPADGKQGLEVGDIILSINGRQVVDFGNLANMEFHCNRSDVPWNILVHRDGQELLLSIPLMKTDFRQAPAKSGLNVALPIVPVETCIGWCGMIMQKPYHDALRQTTARVPASLPPELRQIAAQSGEAAMDVLKSLPYISCIMKGSPGESASLISGFYILRINNSWLYDPSGAANKYPLPRFAASLLKAIQEVESKPDKGSSIRLQLMNRKGEKKVMSIVPDQHYWNTWLMTPNKDDLRAHVTYHPRLLDEATKGR